jgi:hypothetical protein
MLLAILTVDDRDRQRTVRRVMANGVHLGPEAALEALARENISFTVKGNAGYEQRVAATRGAAPAPF